MVKVLLSPPLIAKKKVKFYFTFSCAIIKGLENKIKTLENNQKPKINPSKGVIYIIQTSDGIGHYKIGKTKDLRKRLNSYNGDKKDDIIPLYIYETSDIDKIEVCIKAYAKQYQYRKYKEIYKINIDLLKELINDCGDFNDKTNIKMKWKGNKIEGSNLFIATYRDKINIYFINFLKIYLKKGN